MKGIASGLPSPRDPKKLKRVVCGIWIPLVSLLLIKTDVEQAGKNGCMNRRMDR